MQHFPIIPLPREREKEYYVTNKSRNQIKDFWLTKVDYNMKQRKRRLSGCNPHTRAPQHCGCHFINGRRRWIPRRVPTSKVMSSAPWQHNELKIARSWRQTREEGHVWVAETRGKSAFIRQMLFRTHTHTLSDWKRDKARAWNNQTMQQSTHTHTRTPNG